MRAIHTVQSGRSPESAAILPLPPDVVQVQGGQQKSDHSGGCGSCGSDGMAPYSEYDKQPIQQCL